MTKLIIGQVAGSPSRSNERLFYSSPVDLIDSNLSTLYHGKTFESMLSDIGYGPEPISEGMTAIYSELADNDFTGLGVSFGAGATNVCLVYYAVPVMQFLTVRGGDWIDRQTIQATGTAINKITSTKEDNFQPDFCTDVGGIEGVLSIYYENLLDYVIGNIEREVGKKDIEEGLDMPVVVIGDTPSPKGSEELFEHHPEGSTTPFSVNRVWSIDRPLYNVVCGSLVAAHSEEESGGSTSDSEPEAEATPELS